LFLNIDAYSYEQDSSNHENKKVAYLGLVDFREILEELIPLVGNVWIIVRAHRFTKKPN